VIIDLFIFKRNRKQAAIALYQILSPAQAQVDVSDHAHR
jgi:hypothetical protein